jgi:hypothetical protein
VDEPVFEYAAPQGRVLVSSDQEIAAPFVREDEIEAQLDTLATMTL